MPTIRLHFTDNATSETGFSVERSETSSSQGFAQIGTIDPRAGTGAVTYDDTTAEYVKEYWYRVKAVGTNASSACSNVAHIQTSMAWQRRGAAISVNNAQEPSVIPEAGAQVLDVGPDVPVFKMFYTTYSVPSNLCYAESLDGLNDWTEHPDNPISNGTDEFAHAVVRRIDGVLRVFVQGHRWTLSDDLTSLIDDGSVGFEWNGNSESWKEAEGDYRLLFDTTLGLPWTWYIRKAVSTDGLHFTDDGILLQRDDAMRGGMMLGRRGPSDYWIWVHVTAAGGGSLPTDIALYHWDGTNPPVPDQYWGLNRGTSDEGVGTAVGQNADPEVHEVGGRTYMYYGTNTNGNTGTDAIIKVATVEASLAVITAEAHPVEPPEFVSGQVATLTPEVVEIVFSTEMFSAAYDDGVIIKVNGSTASIVSAARQTDKTIIHYELSAAVIPGDAVTWEYEKASGDIVREDRAIALEDVNARSVTNNVVETSIPWVAQWEFNNDGLDSVGANHLTPINSPTFTTGKLGGSTGATQLAVASHQYWKCASTSDLQLGNVDFLIVAWVYMDSLPVVDAPIVAKLEGNEYLFDLPSADNHFRLYLGPAGQVHATNFGVPSLSTWHLVMVWFDSVAGVMYISVDNGTPNSNSKSGDPITASADFAIGQRLDVGPTEFDSWDGRIDLVAIAKGPGSVPSTSQRNAIWNGGAGTETLP